jgi:hypothetical protein
MHHDNEDTGVDDVDTARGDRARRRDERGEGVISTAIAVLIIALLGAALWAGFSSIMGEAADNTQSQIEKIGS